MGLYAMSKTVCTIAQKPVEQLNAAEVFVDAHVREGRGEKAAILCGDRTVTYQDLLDLGFGRI